ncbi:MAG: SIS domain-containing protein [Anaerolineae bacterium]
MSYLEQEIREQPAAIERLLELERPQVEQVAAMIRERDVRFVMIAARGTSDHAGLYAKYLLAAMNGLPVALATPSLYTFYRRPPQLRDTLVLAISQSGQSADILEVVHEGNRQGALTVAITNDVSSPLAQTAAMTLDLHAGPERAVAATKTYTTSLALLALLSAVLAQDAERLTRLERLPDDVQRTLSMAEEVIGPRSERYRFMENCVIIGRGYNYATAFEIALKLKELTYVVAMPYSSADFLHGPMAVVEPGFPVVVTAPSGDVYADMVEFLRRLHERRADMMVVSDRAEALSVAQVGVPLPTGVPEWLSPVITVIPGQLLALHLTLAKGLEPDAPRGLSKVTITR